MSRIRSIHPSLFTDEDFMSLSLGARVCLPGIWTECDDQGVFAWKPLTLKARLLPADNADMVAILAELETAGFVCRFSADGKDYGAVRNFRKFQRPKSPTAVHPLPQNIRIYVGLSPAPSPDMGKGLPSNGENRPQMEDGGCKGKGRKLSAGADQSKPSSTYSEDFEKFWIGYPTDRNMSKKAAFKRWKALSPEQRTSALAAVPAFRAYCEQNKSWYRPKHAEGWLAGERFDGFLTEAANDPGMSPERLAELRDRTDQIMKRGKYAEALS